MTGREPIAPIALRLSADGPFLNSPRLPLLILRQALPETNADAVERLFRKNGWGGTWQDGVFPYRHYHSNAHEVLGVCAGTARIQFGGPAGPILSVSAGDVVLLPAGTAYRKVKASADFLVVGAYPAGQEDYDLIRDEPEKRSAAAGRVAAVPLLPSDPVYEAEGPLLKHWTGN